MRPRGDVQATIVEVTTTSYGCQPALGPEPTLTNVCQ
jgi:hypothetical protein